MKSVDRVKWLSSFDIEPLISSTLRNGTVAGTLLIAASLIARWAGGGVVHFGHALQAKSIPSLLLADLQRVGSPEFWPYLLMHLGLSLLLLTPYARVAASLAYFTWVEPNRKYVLFSGFTLIILTITLLTVLV